MNRCACRSHIGCRRCYLLGDLRALEGRHQASRSRSSSGRERSIVGDDEGKVVAAELRQLAGQIRALQRVITGISASPVIVAFASQLLSVCSMLESILASNFHVTCPP